ncbi:MAG: DUF2891 domain-containing protein [Thermoplasmatota archaeon]
MNIPDIVDILSERTNWAESEMLKTLAKAPLKCIEKEYPHYIHSIQSAESLTQPKDLHPVFFGCFDWHSSVHSHWSLVRQLRLFKKHPLKSDIINSLDARFTKENVAKEVKYFKENRSFEKPYGWGWFIRLMAELYLWDNKIAARWKEILTPLEKKLLELTESEFLTQSFPMRVGTHPNSAFALQCFLDYAKITSNNALKSKIIEKSKEFFFEDEDYPIKYEPIGWDFLSPALTEADLMHRVLTKKEYKKWFVNFLPILNSLEPNLPLEPIEVELDEMMKFHLVGLNLSRSWCLFSISSKIDDNEISRELKNCAEKHAKEGLNQAFSEEYHGSHWLLSFVFYLFTMKKDGIDPS